MGILKNGKKNLPYISPEAFSRSRCHFTFTNWYSNSSLKKHHKYFIRDTNLPATEVKHRNQVSPKTSCKGLSNDSRPFFESGLYLPSSPPKMEAAIDSIMAGKTFYPPAFF